MTGIPTQLGNFWERNHSIPQPSPKAPSGWSITADFAEVWSERYGPKGAPTDEPEALRTMLREAYEFGRAVDDAGLRRAVAQLERALGLDGLPLVCNEAPNRRKARA